MSTSWSRISGQTQRENELLVTDYWHRPLIPDCVSIKLTPRLSLVNVLRHQLPMRLDATFGV
jgi:hypothetical protein